MNAIAQLPQVTFDIYIEDKVELSHWEQETTVIFGDLNLRVTHTTDERTEYESICGEADTAYWETDCEIAKVELEIQTAKGLGYIDITKPMSNSLYDVIQKEIEEQAA